MRLAIYARYSDDTQDPRSIDDQVRLCREHAERAGLGAVIGVYADYALTGAALRTRPEAIRLIADARTGAFDGVLIEALDRLSRDQEDIAAIHKRLSFAGIKLVSVAEGEINELHIGLKGTMNALFLKDLAAKVRRGQAGRAAAGSTPGGRAYGYRVVREIDARGELVRGKRAIDEAEAQIVRRIYAEYIAGKSPRAIAIGLNRDRAPAPSGGAWNPNSVAGGRSRGSGILWNEIYAGRLVYNRTRFVRDPETGKRLSRPNPPALWVRAEVPDLAIIDTATWEAAQARHAHYAGRSLNACHRPRHPFSGLLRCACCGSGYVIRRRDELGCAGMHDRGICDNRATLRVGELERRVLDGLQRRLLAPDAIAAYVREYHAERARLRQDERRRAAQIETRLTAVAGELKRLVDALATGLAAAKSVRDRLLGLESERRDLAGERDALRAAEDVVALHPGTIERYRTQVRDLAGALAGEGDTRLAAIAILREFVDHIAIGPPPAAGQPATVTAHGLLPRVLAFATRQQQTANHMTVSMVAGEGLRRDRRTVAVAC